MEAPWFCAQLARGKPRAVAQRKIQFSLLLERYWTQRWWEGEQVGSRARTDPLLYTKTHQCLHKGCRRDKES